MSKFCKAKPLRTIYEVHREMYDIIFQELKEFPRQAELIEKLETAYLMAKKMDAKLRQYNAGYGKDWWEAIHAGLVAETLKRRAGQ